MTTLLRALPVAIIAEDEELGRLLLSEAAAVAGLVSQCFDNGADALEAALQSRVAIALLDVSMPGLDGLTVCRRMREDPRFDGVPIVIVTGHDDSEAVRMAFEAGATDFVSKPVNWALLPKRLEYILRNAEAGRALHERMSQVSTLVEALPDSLWVVSGSGEIRWSSSASTAARRRDVVAAEESDAAIAPAQQMPKLLAAIALTAADGLHRKLEFRVQEGAHPRCYELRLSRREGGDVVVIRQDTTERTLAAEHIERLAYFDPLTGLANRHCCLDKAGAWMSAATPREGSVALIYMDLNGFKRVNDTFGHSVGDTVLRTVAVRLGEAVEGFHAQCDELLVARLGGDEFVVVVSAKDARAMGLRVADSCRMVLGQPIGIDALEFHCAPSIGMAVFPDDGADVATVLKHADTAMYQSKADGADGVVEYSTAMSTRLRDWLALEARLRRAVRDEMLHLVFQPKFHLHDGRIAGAEALLRWRDDEHGEVSPARFVEIAEDSGLIIQMSSWVVRAVCRQLRHWLDQGVAIPVAINCSAKEMMHGDPAAVIAAEAAAANIPPSLIEVEITESLLANDSASVQKVLHNLRLLGCRIALDDFGTRYSALSYITRFPPDRIKIDKAFVQNVDRSPADAAVANAILSLASSLNLSVTAEGIERVEQLEWLRERGCHEGQGFYLSRPLSPYDFTRLHVTPVATQDPQSNTG
ncbi:MAG: EAL domain-containing protein [Pseudomonadota bacterium]